MSSKYGYIGYGPDTSPVVVAKQVFSPTGVQTNFTFAAGYQIGYLDVYVNGARQIEGQDFSATDTSTVGLSTAAQSGDVLELVAYKAYNLATPSAVGNFTVGGNLVVTGTTVSAAGSITASSFYGSGANLTGVISGVGIATAAGTVGTGVTLIDFRGAGISTVTVSSGIATVNIEGGAGGGFSPINFILS